MSRIEMVVFVEGPDKAGKSKLCDLLSRKFGLKIERMLKPENSDKPFPEFRERIRSITESIVFDRGYQSEYVYSELWRDGCWMSYQDFTRLDGEACFKAKHVFLINCFAPVEVLKKRMIDEHEELLQQSEVEQCVELYRQVMKISCLPVIDYDSSVQDPEEVVISLVKMMNTEKNLIH